MDTWWKASTKCTYCRRYIYLFIYLLYGLYTH